jgi:hypothetical protein
MGAVFVTVGQGGDYPGGLFCSSKIVDPSLDQLGPNVSRQ